MTDIKAHYDGLVIVFENWVSIDHYLNQSNKPYWYRQVSFNSGFKATYSSLTLVPVDGAWMLQYGAILGNFIDMYFDMYNHKAYHLNDVEELKSNIDNFLNNFNMLKG